MSRVRDERTERNEPVARPTAMPTPISHCHASPNPFLSLHHANPATPLRLNTILGVATKHSNLYPI